MNRYCHLASVLLTIFSAGCDRWRHPDGVPPEAVRVAFSESGGWAHCWLDKAAQVNRCRTYNADGRRLYRFRKERDDDDVFLKYEGSGAVPEAELEIDALHTGPDVIWLKNGVVLIPKNDFGHQKQFVDELMRARANGPP